MIDRAHRGILEGGGHYLDQSSVIENGVGEDGDVGEFEMTGPPSQTLAAATLSRTMDISTASKLMFFSGIGLLLYLAYDLYDHRTQYEKWGREIV